MALKWPYFESRRDVMGVGVGGVKGGEGIKSKIYTLVSF